MSRFDEEPDGDIHMECAEEIHVLQSMLAWAYAKLHNKEFRNIEDALKLDEIKLYLEHGQCQ